MAWMRLSPLFLCTAILLVLASGAMGKPVQAKSAQNFAISSIDDSSRTVPLKDFRRRIS